MSRPFFYCSELSRASAEQSFGTASIGEVWLLVEYREAWGAHALAESTLPARVKHHLNQFCKANARARVLFIKQERLRTTGALNCFVVRSRERAPTVWNFQLSDYAELLDIDIAALAGGTPFSGARRTNEPLYLVCTHGKRDKCCAKFGYALYKSLHESAAGGGGRVWQSSHVGGDRFAANLLCFPHGLFYAHVTDEAGQRIVSEYEERRLVLENFRGRACYSYPVQSAEFFIRRETGLRALDALTYLGHERTGERSWLVKFTGTGTGTIHEAHLDSRPSAFHNYITCHAEEQKRVVQYVLTQYRSGTMKEER